MYCIIKMNLPDGNTTAEKIDESGNESVDNVEVSRISSESAINAADTLNKEILFICSDNQFECKYLDCL